MLLIACRVQYSNRASDTVLLLRQTLVRPILTWKPRRVGGFATRSSIGSHETPKKLHVEKSIDSRQTPSLKPFDKAKGRKPKFSSSPKPSSSTGTHGKAPAVPSSGIKEYPAQMLIYHARTGLTIFVASFKLLAVFVFIFSSLAIAPAYYFSPLEPTWMAAVMVGVGTIPMMIMVFMTPPYVTYIHLTLPQWARLSQRRLYQFAQNLPPSAALDMTTVRWIWPRVTRISASELYLRQYPAGSYMLQRNVPKEVYAARTWYHWRPIKRFLVAGKGGRVVDSNIWTEVLSCVRRGWSNDPRYKGIKPGGT